MNNDNKVTPIIKDGELYTGEKKPKKEISTEPPKTGKFGNILLTLFAILIIIYGVNSLINNKDTKEEKEPEVTSNEETSNTPTEVKESVEVLKSYVILPGDYSVNVFTSDDNKYLPAGLKNFSSNYILAISSLKCATFDKNGTIDGPEMDSKVKAIFGEIGYQKGNFTVGPKTYTYNAETDKYYVLSTSPATNNFIKYNFVESREEENMVYINEYVAYTNATSSVTIGNVKLPSRIDGTNIQTSYKSLKYYEYAFQKNNDDYVLISITIK